MFCTALGLSIAQHQQLVMPPKCFFIEAGSDIVASIFAQYDGQYFHYRLLSMHSC